MSRARLTSIERDDLIDLLKKAIEIRVLETIKHRLCSACEDETQRDLQTQKRYGDFGAAGVARDIEDLLCR